MYMCRFALGFYYGTYIRETTESMKAILTCPHPYMLLCVCEGFTRESKKRDYNKERTRIKNVQSQHCLSVHIVKKPNNSPLNCDKAMVLTGHEVFVHYLGAIMLRVNVSGHGEPGLQNFLSIVHGGVKELFKVLILWLVLVSLFPPLSNRL